MGWLLGALLGTAIVCFFEWLIYRKKMKREAFMQEMMVKYPDAFFPRRQHACDTHRATNQEASCEGADT